MFIYSDNLMNCLLKIIIEKSFHYFNTLPYTYPYELCSMLGARMKGIHSVNAHNEEIT